MTLFNTQKNGHCIVKIICILNVHKCDRRIPELYKERKHEYQGKGTSIKCSSRLWWNCQFCKELKIGVIPFPSIVLGRRTIITTITSAMIQLTADIAMALNQRNPLDRTFFVAVDLSGVFHITHITTCYQRSTDYESLHGEMALLLYMKKASQDLLHRFKVNVYESWTLSTHSLNPCWSRGQFDLTACGVPTSFSVHLASSTITPAGSVFKSRGDNLVRM